MWSFFQSNVSSVCKNLLYICKLKAKSLYRCVAELGVQNYFLEYSRFLLIVNLLLSTSCKISLCKNSEPAQRDSWPLESWKVDHISCFGRLGLIRVETLLELLSVNLHSHKASHISMVTAKFAEYYVVFD